MKIKLLSEVLKEYPDFKPGWQKTDDGFANPKFGYVNQVVNCDDSGKPLYDQPQIGENPGSIVIPYFVGYKKGILMNYPAFYLGVIEKNRTAIKDSKTGEAGNVYSVEFPMGYGLTPAENLEEIAKRELSEETKSVVKNLHYLGSINPLPVFYAEQKSNEVFAAEVDDEKIQNYYTKQLSKEAKKEGIISSQFLSLEEIYGLVKSGRMFCGLSQAALAKFMISLKS